MIKETKDKIKSDAANPGYISMPIVSALVASHLHKDPNEMIKLLSTSCGGRRPRSVRRAHLIRI